MIYSFINSILLFLLISFPTISNAPISQPFGNLGHVGVDFSIPVGTEIYSTATGIVIVEEHNARCYGNYLMIKHIDGYVSLYAHLSEFKVKKGDWVISGQLIAFSGGDPNDNISGDGWSSGPHLHFEIRIPEHINNNLYNIDPMEFLGLNNEE